MQLPSRRGGISCSVERMEGATLLLFPGLGVDRRIYAPQLSLPIRIEIREWIEPESMGESLHHYADRLAGEIGPRPDAYVGGISLGSMVAMEVATRLDARGIVVIGGCSSHRQISPLFRSVLRVAAALPTSAIRPVLKLAPAALALFEKLPKEQRRLMTRMLQEHSPFQTRWSCRAILEWECCALPPAMPIFSVHGEEDAVIPVKNVSPRVVVAGGRHLINLSHAGEVNRFICESVLAAT